MIDESIGPDGFTFAGKEGATTRVSGTMDIAYGAQGSFRYLHGCAMRH